jgi:hypothetical protein
MIQVTTLLNNFGLSQAQCKANQFFGLKPWYQYLQLDDKCDVKNFQVLPPDGKSDLLLIGVAIVDDLLRIAGLVAIGFIIYGGILYVTSQGSPDQTGKAQNTIINALVGLVISIISVALVSFLGNKIG